MAMQSRYRERKNPLQSLQRPHGVAFVPLGDLTWPRVWLTALKAQKLNRSAPTEGIAWVGLRRPVYKTGMPIYDQHIYRGLNKSIFFLQEGRFA